MKTIFMKRTYLTLLLCLVFSLHLAACAQPSLPGPTETTLPSAGPTATTLAPSPTPATASTASPAPTSEQLPQSTEVTTQNCEAAGLEVYDDSERGFCFAYPSGFTLKESEDGSGLPVIHGPALGEGPEPIQASLSVSIKPVPSGSDLTRLVDAYLSHHSFQNLPWEIVRTPLKLGGEPSEMLEDVPGLLSSRQVMAVHGEALYTLTFHPSDMPEAEPDLEALYQAVADSFTFQANTSNAQPAPGLETVDWLEFDRVISFSYDPLLAPWVDVITVDAVPISPQVMFADSHPAAAQFRFLGFRGGRIYQLPYPLWDAQLLVFKTAGFPGFGDDQPNGFVNQKNMLEGLLQNDLDPTICAEPPAGSPALPFLPWLNSAQTFCAQPEVIEFTGGKGIRYLTHFSQGIGPVLDREVFYTFQGLTGDGQLYISAAFPVATGVFPAEPDPDFDFETWQSVLEEQLANLNALPGEQIDPSLDELDALISSIQIE